jgi:PAS domain S-box-containing protein
MSTQRPDPVEIPEEAPRGRRKFARIARAASPYTAFLGTLLLASTLLATISITHFERQWVVFLGGVLASAIIAWVSRFTNARWTIARRTAQLNLARGRLATESRLRLQAEETLARMRNNAEFVNEAMPAMLAYVDGEGRVRYHNHAFARWVGLEEKMIDGQRLEDIVGRAGYAQIHENLKEAEHGRDVRGERTQALRSGKTSRIYEQYLAHYAKDGKVVGVFAVLTEITVAGDLAAPEPEVEDTESVDMGARLLAALERDEFSLHCQSIAPLGHGAAEAPFHEVLLRMNEEEENLLPPGMFLPVAEELGLLHEIDRWVVRHVVAFAAKAGPHRVAVYFVNLSAPTILDAGFAGFVRARLKEHGVAGQALCFELTEAGLLSNPAAYRSFIDAFSGTGCRFAVSGFGRNPLSLQVVKQLHVDFLKLDGGVVLDILRTPAGLAKVKAINQIAHAAGMRTIAECVESDTARGALARIGTDFAQGFGIALPQPINALDEGAAESGSPRQAQRIAA